MSSTKRIAIIGAGVTGMTTAKACLEQGHQIVVFEATDYTGGLWRYHENVDQNGIASVMKSTVINTSKEMTAFSDFPPPDNFANYMHNTKMVEYLDMYGERFGFTKYVRFRTKVQSIVEAKDYNQTGRWIVKSQNLDNSNLKEEEFDGVAVCNGHHTTVNVPTLPGQEHFKGTLMHTHSLKTTRGFEDKVVVIVGIGNSSGDAAVDLAMVAKQVYLSTRRGAWITRRVGPEGRPQDQLQHRRINWIISGHLPFSWNCDKQEKICNQFFDHQLFGLKPKHRILSQHIMINDFLPNRILAGTVQVKGDVDHFTEDGVVFKGESKVTKCDVVIFATGYKISFQFISEQILPVTQNKVRLYKHQFVHNRAHPETLALIGLAQPIGSILPISELQARWFSLLMAGKLTLPSFDEMERDVCAKEAEIKRRFYKSERHTIKVDLVPFMDELAQQIGVYPPIWKYFFTDTKLWYTLIFGASASYQYRLIGPNSWPGAREAMLTLQERIIAPLNTNHSIEMDSQTSNERNLLRKIVWLSLGLVCVSYLSNKAFPDWLGWKHEFQNVSFAGLVRDII